MAPLTLAVRSIAKTPNPCRAALALVLLGAILGSPCQAVTLQSPSGNIRLVADLHANADGGQSVAYRVFYNGEQVMDDSGVSFQLEDGSLIGGSLSQSAEPVFTSNDTSWNPLFGERSTVRDHYNQVVLKLRDQESGYAVRLTFRCYDSGVAFQTDLKALAGAARLAIADELSEFNFLSDHTVWCTERTQGDHHALPLSKVEGLVERPVTIRVDDHTYAAITEAKLVDYASMKLRSSTDKPCCLVSQLRSHVEADGQLSTPWRVVTLGGSAGQLLESNDIVLNLNDPCAIADTSWIRPGKVIREITLSTPGGKACVDFAVEHGFKYIEFDAGWYGHEYSSNSDATTITVDPKRSKGPFDLHEVIEYAAKRDIGVIVYVNRRALETQLDEILPLYQKWGLKGVKYGFVNTGSQQWNRWLHEAVRKAADHKLMVDIHDEYRPVGYSRTYPNLMTQEGVRGDEAAPDSDQALTTLFTRNLAGAADHTICYFDKRVEDHWTHGHQLAKAVCTYSPWQFMFWYDTPLSPPPPGRHNNQIVRTPELEFFKQVPTVWDDTRVIHGEIGQYAVIARRKGQDWYVGAMNNGKQRSLEVPLDFLGSDKAYRARVYSDDPSVSTATRVRIDDKVVDSSTQLKVKLQPNGGEAIWLTPSKELASVEQASRAADAKH